MRHLVIVAHPADDSLTMRIAQAYATEWECLQHTQRTYDLYRMRFNPILFKEELLPIPENRKPKTDVVNAQNDIVSADALTFIYPLWWLSMPAMMKDYIDRVFARGFAYESSHRVVRGLLVGKKAVLITLSGAPMPVLVKSGNWQAVEALQDTHIFRAAGCELLEHRHFDDVAAPMPNAIAAAHLQSAMSCAQMHFG